MATKQFYNLETSFYSEYTNDALTPEENNALFYKWHTDGDSSVRNTIICKNIKLVVYIANRYIPLDNSIDMEDIIQTGIVGLIRAVDSYDPDRGYAFSTYAAKCINNELSMLWRKYKFTKLILSLEEQISSESDEDGLRLMDTIEDPESNFTQDIEDQSIAALIDQHLDDLPDKKKNIICMLYGLRGCERHTQTELSIMLNCTRSNISRINKSCIAYLRDKLIDDLFK